MSQLNVHIQRTGCGTLVSTWVGVFHEIVKMATLTIALNIVDNMCQLNFYVKIAKLHYNVYCDRQLTEGPMRSSIRTTLIDTDTCYFILINMDF